MFWSNSIKISLVGRATEPWFNIRLDVLSQDFVKSRSRENGSLKYRIDLKLDRHISSSAAEVPVKFYSDWPILNITKCYRQFPVFGTFFLVCTQGFVVLVLFLAMQVHRSDGKAAVLKKCVEMEVSGLSTVTEFQYFVEEMRLWVRKFFLYPKVTSYLVTAGLCVDFSLECGQ